jgi:hypothetical protein
MKSFMKFHDHEIFMKFGFDRADLINIKMMSCQYLPGRAVVAAEGREVQSSAVRRLTHARRHLLAPVRRASAGGGGHHCGRGRLRSAG